MRLFLILFAMLQFSAAAALANVFIAFDDLAQTGGPGDTLIFTGILSNTGPNTIFLNSANLNLAGSGFAPDFIGPFFDNVPLSLDPGQMTSDIELFDILLKNPFTDTPGTYAGSYTLVGGIDSSAQDVLNSAGFSISETTGSSTVPEPCYVGVLGIGLGALLILRRRHHSVRELFRRSRRASI